MAVHSDDEDDDEKDNDSIYVKVGPAKWQYMWIGEFGEMDKYRWDDVNMTEIMAGKII